MCIRKYLMAGILAAGFVLEAFSVVNAQSVDENLEIMTIPFLEMVKSSKLDRQITMNIPIDLLEENIEETDKKREQVKAETENIISQIEQSVADVFGAEVYEAAEYPLSIYQNRMNGTVMYWYNSEADTAIGMQLTSTDIDKEWNLTLIAAPYRVEPVRAAELPLGLSYNMSDIEIRTALAGYPVVSSIILEGTLAERMVYTVFLPENEIAEYVQLETERVSLQSMASYAGDKFWTPSGRRLIRGMLYINDEADTELLVSDLEASWGIVMDSTFSMDDLDYGEKSGKKWYAERLTADVMDSSWLDESELAERWDYLWDVYESVSLRVYEEEEVPTEIFYHSRAQVMIPVLERWLDE